MHIYLIPIHHQHSTAQITERHLQKNKNYISSTGWMVKAERI